MSPQIDPTTGERVQTAGVNIDPETGERVQPPAAAPAEQPSRLESLWKTATEPRKPRPNSGYIGQVGTSIGNIEGRALANVGGMIAHPIDTLSGIWESAKPGGAPAVPKEVVMKAAQGQPLSKEEQQSLMIGAPSPSGPLEQRVQQFREEYAKNPATAVENAAGDVLAMYLAGKITDLAVGAGKSALGIKPKVGDMIRTKYGPRTTELAGEKVPGLVGEAAPTSKPGRLQTMLKRSGMKAPKFEEFEKGQQAAVKNVIRKTAQQTSGFTGPMSEEPGAAMESAADATFERARPMYAALDESAKTVPDAFQNASKVTLDAINRARKLGVDIEVAPAEESIIFSGKKLTRADNPQLWDNLKAKGIINDAGEGTPIAAYMKVRSQLLKMQRGASDAALRFKIGEEVASMSKNMEEALKGTDLLDTWKEADRLWSKGYVLNTLSDSLYKSTKGAEPTMQPKGYEKVPTKVQGESLIKELQDLRRSGMLERALSPEEASNLEQSAVILERAQNTRIGHPEGAESTSLYRSVGKAIVGNPAAVGGAIIGGLTHGIYGAEVGAFTGLLIQQVGTRVLINAMTKTEGLAALKSLASASTPSAAQSAIAALKAAGAMGAAQLRKVGDILPKKQ